MALDPRVAVGIINYGDYRHLPVCPDSVKGQSLAPVYPTSEIDFAHDDHESLTDSAVTAMV